MKNKLYINGISSISAQAGEEIFSGGIREYYQNIFPAIDKNYREFIKPMMLRRMSKAVKMGIAGAKIALADARVEMPDVIITGTGEGCKQDTGKFLENLLEQEENLLAPTSFIQSTHNTVGGQIALDLKCTGYNVTYTQDATSLESALMDAQLKLMEESELKSVLVGGVDETDEKITPLYSLDGQLKEENIKNIELLESTSPGTIASEGAHFFSISAEKNQKTYAELLDVKLFNSASSEEVENIIEKFLSSQDLMPKDIDVIILGNNGDARFDDFYKSLQKGMFGESLQLGYKHLVGEYNTAPGYALWLACQLFRRKTVPEILKLNQVKKNSFRHVLLYNQYLGRNHGLTILRTCES